MQKDFSQNRLLGLKCVPNRTKKFQIQNEIDQPIPLLE